MSLATGAGAPLPKEFVQMVLLLKINSLAKGFSGVRSEVIQTLIDTYYAGIIPIIPWNVFINDSVDLISIISKTLQHIVVEAKKWH